MLIEALDILKSKDYFDADVFMQSPNNGQFSDEDSATKNGTDVQHLSAGPLSAPADLILDFGSHVADSILTQEDRRHNFDEEECLSKDELFNSMNLTNEKWFSQQIPL